MQTRRADFYDIRVIRSTGLTLMIDNGDVKEISNNYVHGLSCRALVKGSWGFVTSDDPGEIDSALSSAIRLAGRSYMKSARPPIRLADVPAPVVHDLPEVKKDPSDIPVDEKVGLLLQLHRAAKVSGITSTSVIYSESRLELEYRSSEGVEAAYSLARTGFAITAVASQNGIYQMGRESRFDICGYDLFDRYDAFQLAEKAGNTARELLNARVPKGGRLPVILDPELAGVFIHEAVGHSVEADHVMEGNSILSGRINSQIAAETITVVDDPTMHGFGYYPFDDEGVEAAPTTLIENGILKSYLHSRETAAKLPGTGSPGNARSQGFSRPIIRMSNTYIKDGDSNFDEMVSEMRDGIYLIGSRGGQVNTGEGVFQFNAEKGYLVEDGELASMLRDVSLSGHTLELLKNIRLTADDREMNSGRCGKGGQLVPVTDGSPHLMISGAVVGGSG